NFGRGSGLGTLATLRGVAYFAAGDDTNGIKLWRSDGTAAGTRILKDVFPRNFCAFRGQLYFAGSDGVHGTQLWKTAGTEEGTVAVTSDLPSDNHGSYFDSPYSLCVVGDQLFFFSPSGNPLRPFGLWKSDGESQPLKLAEFIGAQSVVAGCPMICGLEP